MRKKDIENCIEDVIKEVEKGTKTEVGRESKKRGEEKQSKIESSEERKTELEKDRKRQKCGEKK